jgi:hypothetical protein
MTNDPLQVKLKNYVRGQMNENFSSPQSSSPNLLRKMVIPSSGRQGYEHFQPTTHQEMPMTFMAVSSSGHQGYESFQPTTRQEIPMTYMAVPSSGHQGYVSFQPMTYVIPGVGHQGYQRSDASLGHLNGYDSGNPGASIATCFETQPLIDNRSQCKK